jgi:hypothetical protein
MLERFATDWPVVIEDMTEFVVAQRSHTAPGDWARLQMPVERVYLPGS